MEEIAEAGNEDAEHFGIIKSFDEKIISMKTKN